MLFIDTVVGAHSDAQQGSNAVLHTDRRSSLPPVSFGHHCSCDAEDMAHQRSIWWGLQYVSYRVAATGAVIPFLTTLHDMPGSIGSLQAARMSKDRRRHYSYATGKVSPSRQLLIVS